MRDAARCCKQVRTGTDITASADRFTTRRGDRRGQIRLSVYATFASRLSKFDRDSLVARELLFGDDGIPRIVGQDAGPVSLADRPLVVRYVSVKIHAIVEHPRDIHLMLVTVERTRKAELHACVTGCIVMHAFSRPVQLKRSA
jgi:hypothetical protein